MTMSEMKRECRMREKKNTEIKGQISYYLAVKGYTKQELAAQLNISIATLYNKLRNPNSFTLEEIRNLRVILDLTDSRVLDIV